VISAGPGPSIATTTALLELDLNRLLVPTKPNYAEITDYLETHGTKVEPKSLQDLIEQLKQLSETAEKRAETCEKAIRLIHEQKKDLESEQAERDHQAEQVRLSKARKEESSKKTKAKKRKDRTETLESVEIKREGVSSQTLALGLGITELSSHDLY
jgi:chromatin remodeling complex protein RSC6